MRAGFLILNLNVRGSVRRVVELSNRLVRRGHDAVVYTWDGVPCNWLPMEAETAPLEAIAGEHDLLIKLGGPELTPFWKAATARRKVLYLLGFNQSVTPDIAAMLRGTRRPPDLRTAETVAAIREGRTIANCTAISRWVEEISGLPCPTVLAGVDRETFRPGLRPKEPFLILAGGGKQGVDGTQDVLDMMKRVAEAEPRAGLELYYYRGYTQAELAGWYCAADVFVDAHRAGGWNNPVAEAMACRTAVVCTDIWGNLDFARHDETALVVQPGDVEGLAEAVLRVFREGALRTRLAAAGLEAIRPFTWERATDALEEVLCARS